MQTKGMPHQLLTALSVLAMGVALSSASAQTFSILDLGTPAGSVWSSPASVNGRGDVAGKTIYSGNATLPFVKLYNSALTLLPTPGATTGRALTINSNRVVGGQIGNYAAVWQQDSGGVWQTTNLNNLTLSNGGSAASLDYFFTVVVSINDSSDMLCNGSHLSTGYVQMSYLHLDPSTGFYGIRFLPYGNSTWALNNAGHVALNDSGQYVYDAIAGQVLYQASASSNTEYAINAKDEFVDSSGYVFQPGVGVTFLGAPFGGTTTSARGINDLTQVVGSSTTKSASSLPFFWQAGKMADLNKLVTNIGKWKVNGAFCISNPPSGKSAGFIVGEGVIGSVQHGVLLIPN